MTNHNLFLDIHVIQVALRISIEMIREVPKQHSGGVTRARVSSQSWKKR